MRYQAAYVYRRLVLAQAFIDDLAQQVVLRPAQVLFLRDQLGPHPMDAALIRAAMAGEDARFCRHHGFDWGAIENSLGSL